MTPPITLRVVGIPAPQGSKTRMPNGALVEGATKGQREKHRAWREAVRATAAAHHTGPPLAEPVKIVLGFFMPGVASDPHRYWHVTQPDIDKLLRSTLDGLVSGGVLADDKWVCGVDVDAWHVPSVAPGCHIAVHSLTASEAYHRAESKKRAAEARRAAKAAAS